MRSVQVRKKYALQAEYKEHGQLGKYQKVTVSGQKIARRRGRDRRTRNTGLFRLKEGPWVLLGGRGETCQ